MNVGTSRISHSSHSHLEFPLRRKKSSCKNYARMKHSYNDQNEAQHSLTSSNQKRCKLQHQLGKNESGKPNALHLLCTLPKATTDEVEDVLKRFPSAAKGKDFCGRTPLVYALKHGCAAEVVKAVFSSYPSAILEKDLCGQMPLLMFYSADKDPELLRQVLDVMPTIALYRTFSFSGSWSVVDRICKPWEHMEKISKEALEMNSILKSSWDKMIMTVQAANRAKRDCVMPQNCGEELHCALELPCKPKLLSHMMDIYSDQALTTMRRQNGRLPLHYVLESKERYDQDEMSYVLQTLLKKCPEAADIDCEGVHPLQVAIKRGFTWATGVEDIMFTAPRGLSHREPASQLLAFMLAASFDKPDLDTVFSLLREGPVIGSAE